MKTYNGKRLVTMKDWIDNFDSCCSKGDYVEEEIVNQIINAVPPACMRDSCMQSGEPYSHEEDPETKQWKPVYTTFKKVAPGIYEYCGHCFRGENVEKKYE